MFIAQHSKGAAIVTGAAKRIGRCIAKIIASNNYDVIIHYNTSKEEALKTKAEIELKYPVKSELLQCDFLKNDSIENFVESAFNLFPHLNILVNNASVFKKCTFMQSTKSIFDAHMDIHLKAPFFLLKEICERRANLNIINMIDKDVLKKDGESYFSYLLAKKSMLILSDMLEVELKQDNSVINCIMPGKILRAGDNDLKKVFLLKKVVNYLLYTKRSGLKIYL